MIHCMSRRFSCILFMFTPFKDVWNVGSSIVQTQLRKHMTFFLRKLQWDLERVSMCPDFWCKLHSKVQSAQVS